MSVTTVRLQPELEESLGAMAEKLHRSKSWLINQALREFFARQELEQGRWQETLQAMEAVAQGKVVSAEAVNTWLQSWGSDNELSPPKLGQ
ncbi:MAG: ribbon-helix-helix protein, CopG family [Pseudomonas sp.]|uniref:CopG family ribbon-helix-helix protein n=1 Tax=Pseudomonas sp. TaxID=306 RepID=UPI0039819D55